MSEDFVVINDCNVACWKSWLSNSWRKPTAKLLTFTDSKGRKIVSMLNVDVAYEDATMAMDVIGNIHDALKCQTCYWRLCKLRNCRGAGFAPVLSGIGREDCAFNGTVARVRGISIFKGGKNNFYPEVVGSWQHFNVWSVNEVTTDANVDIQAVERTVRRYLPLVAAMFEKHCKPGINDSLHLTASLLEREVTYGGQLLGATQWAQKHLIENWKHAALFERTQIVITAILDAPHVSGSDSVLYYHQFNNTISMLMDKAHDQDAFVHMASALLAPDKYQRRTGEASEGNIKTTLGALGEFSTTHMTLNQAHELPGAIIVRHACDEAPSGTVAVMEKMIDQKKAKTIETSGASGFATRCGVRDLVGKTIQDLMEKGAIENLEIHVDSATHWVGLYDHDLGDKLCYPWLWCFHAMSLRRVGLNGWAKVDSIVPGHPGKFGHQAYFLCRGAKPPPPASYINNCLMEEFLHPSIRRECGKTFAQLNKEVQAIVPENQPLAIGIGAAVKTGIDKKLSSDIKLRVNGGTPFTVSHHH